MLALLLAANLTLLPGMPEDPPKTEAVKPAPQSAPEKAAPAKGAKKHGSVAVPEEVPAEQAKPAPKAVPKVKPAPSVKPEEAKRLAEAEARAARLASENAKLQEALAKKDLPAVVEIATPGAALAELKAGNLRFVEGRRVRTLLASQDAELRQTLAKGQAPFAVIVTCSDSRLMDNFIFDQELGRLFTIREAGNSPDLQGIASVEYAVEHLGSKLVVVMGHTACGAVKAVATAAGKPLPGNLWSLQAAMTGLLETTPEDPNESEADHLRHLEANNAIRQAQAVLDRSELVRHLVGVGKVQVLPAVYELASGKVVFLELPKATAGEEKGHH
jgi:carbonic anhydrase